MRTYRPKLGPFAEAIYLTKDEIERICNDELRSQGLLPSCPQPVRIERFIEKRFVTPTYDDLGPGILGFTKFSPSGVQEIVVNSRLEDEGRVSSERRIRSTLAHEGGHGLLHAHLFALAAENPSLVEDACDPKVLCRDEPDASNQRIYRGKWWEYQANRAIGSLLLPSHLAQVALEQLLESAGTLGLKTLAELNRRRAEEELSDLFDVNPAVARIKLEELYPTSGGDQGML